MAVAALLAQQNPATLKLVRFADDETLRSVQLYGVRPDAVQAACAWLANSHGVHHIDLNFGCPVRKVTAKGGGSALPLRPKLFASLVAAAVCGAGGQVPVTVKVRIGISDELSTHLESARIAEAEGAAAVTLHARTADQLYSPPARWDAIAEIVQAVRVPVIGNGDVFEAADALRMMRSTGCSGVMVGRGCLGRPWLFTELADMFSGRYPRLPPALGSVLDTALQHAVELAAWEVDEARAVRQMRRLVPLYLYGFDTAKALQAQLLAASSLQGWRDAIAQASHDPHEPFPIAGLRHARLKGGGPPVKQKVALPPDWLSGRDCELAPSYMADDACEG